MCGARELSAPAAAFRSSQWSMCSYGSPIDTVLRGVDHWILRTDYNDAYPSVNCTVGQP